MYFKLAPRQTISAAVLPKVRYRAYPFGLVYFKLAPRQTISAAVLPKVRYRAYPFGLASFALIAISQLRLGILTEEGEGSKKQPH